MAKQKKFGRKRELGRGIERGEKEETFGQRFAP